MAQRRMFSKSITNSSQFLMMPQSSQNLYFHLGMNADDDGFCEHFTIMRMTESKPDDLKVLQAKNFISVFDDKVLVITDWKENNYLRSDRYTASKYLEIYKAEILALSEGKDTSGIPKVSKMATQVRLGKVRLGQVSIGKVTNTETSQSDVGIVEIINLFKEVNPSYQRLFAMPPQRAAVSRLLKTHGRDKLESMVNFLSRSNNMEYVPIITTPCQLEDKMGQLVAALQKIKNKTPIIL